MVGMPPRVFGYNGLHDLPGQVELIDTGISSETEPESDASDVAFPSKPQALQERVTTPMRVALDRYAVTKDEVMQHLCDQWAQLLSSNNVNTALERLYEGNSLIGIKRRWLSNYECALLFRHLACQAGGDVELLQRIFVFNLHWWFCSKFDVHLSQFPHLGNEVMLSNATLGLLSTIWARGNLTLHLLFRHDTIGDLFDDVMVPMPDTSGKGRSIEADSCNTLLLRILPILKQKHVEPDNEALCVKVVRFIEGVSVAATGQRFDEGFHNSNMEAEPEYVDYDIKALLDGVWQGVLQCNVGYGASKQTCSCRHRLGKLLVDVVSQILTLDRHLFNQDVKAMCDLLVRRLIGYFAKWVMAKSGNGCLSSSMLGQTAQLLLHEYAAEQALATIGEYIEYCGVLDFRLQRSFKEESDNEADTQHLPEGIIAPDRFIVESFGRLYTSLVGSDYHLYQIHLDIIAGAMMLIENDHLIGDVMFDEGYNSHYMAFHLSNTMHGGSVMAKITRVRHTYRWLSVCTNWGTCPVVQGVSTDGHSQGALHDRADYKSLQDFSFGLDDEPDGAGLCACFGLLHRELCKAAGLSLRDVILIPSLAYNGNFDETRTGVKFSMSRNRALHMLQQLCDYMLQVQTSVGNIPVTTVLPDCTHPTSVLVYSFVAVASLMEYSIFVCHDDKHPGIVRLCAFLDSERTLSLGGSKDPIIYDTSVNVLLRLLHYEIGTDAALALEYGNAELWIYRTLLVHCIHDALTKPTHDVFSIDFSSCSRVDFDVFMRRLMRLIFFRVHHLLLERPKFEAFMRMRVVYYHVNKSLDDDEFLEEIDSGYLNIGEELDTADADSNGEFDGEIDYRIFGFLEFSEDHSLNHSIIKNHVKCEAHAFDSAVSVGNNAAPTPDCGDNDMTMLFFESVFALCGQLRFCVDKSQLFQHNKVDKVLYQMFLHICHADNNISNQRRYESSVLDNVKRVYETTEYGEVLKRSGHLQTLGFGSEDGSNLVTLRLNEDTCGERPMNSCYINLDLLFLSRRKFTKRVYYDLSRMIIESLVRWLSPQSAACALCRWASSIPIDSTSRIKSQKHATAQAIVTMLSLSMLCHMAHASASDLSVTTLEPLVSAANVCFVNLKVSINCRVFSEDAFEIEDDVLDGDHVSPNVKGEPMGETAGGTADVLKVRVKHEYPSESDVFSMTRKNGIDTFEGAGNTRPYVPGELQVWKQRKLREHRARQHQLNRMKRELRRKLLVASVHLLQVCVVFVHILGYVVLRTADHILDPANGFVAAGGNTNGGSEYHHNDTGDNIDNNEQACSPSHSVQLSATSTGSTLISSDRIAAEDIPSGALSSHADGLDETLERVGAQGCPAPRLIRASAISEPAMGPPLTESDAPSHTCGRRAVMSESFADDIETLQVGDVNRSVEPVEHQLQLSGDPKLRVKVASLLQFIKLSCNALDSLFCACSSVSCNCLTEDLDVTIYDNDTLLTAGEEELGLLLHEISFLKEEINSHLGPLLSLHREAVADNAACVGSDAPSDQSQDAGSDSEGDDDLASFLDFETDSYLGMVTSKDSSKLKSTAARLKDIELRCEWNCLIKSYLS